MHDWIWSYLSQKDRPAAFFSETLSDENLSFSFKL